MANCGRQRAGVGACLNLLRWTIGLTCTKLCALALLCRLGVNHELREAFSTPSVIKTQFLHLPSSPLSPRLNSPISFGPHCLLSFPTIAMSSRPSYRLFQASRNLFRQPLLRRRIQTAAPSETQANQSGFAKLWNSPVGPKTVHFWYRPFFVRN